MTVDPKAAFSALPPTLTADLLDAFNEVLTNFANRRWEPSELNGGKLCEAAFTIVSGYLDGGNYPSRAKKPRNIVLACQTLETTHATAPRSPRIQLPRMIVALYEIRNNRGVGHAGGDVNPNEMDATAVLYMSKWIVSELVRILHGLTTDEATDVVEGLIEREQALIWKSQDTRRVLPTGLTQKSQVLLLLASVASASEADLASWLEHKRLPDLRRAVLRPMHKSRLLEYDEKAKTLHLLPPGIDAAEALIRSLRV